MAGLRRPVVGVTASRHRGRVMSWLVCAALLRAGAWPRRILPDRMARATGIDALVIGGGDDIDARLYGGEVRATVRRDPERDQLELALLERAAARPLPVLGICRGAQILNVFRGGTLIGDIAEAFDAIDHRRTVLPRKTVTIERDSRLFAIVGKTRDRVNALHHQSVDRPGDGLRVVARDDQGLVQALEAPGAGFVMGVQWHPEFLLLDRGQQRLFRALVRAARDSTPPGAA